MSRTRKASAEFTAAEVEVLQNALACLRTYRAGHRENSRDGKGPTINRIDQKLWSLYADTHPEDGPFK